MIPDPCAVVVLAFDSVESNDQASPGSAEGSVSGACVMGTCSGSDPFDRWRIEPACGGTHRIKLMWDRPASDLDLYLSDVNDQQIAQSATVSTAEESILIALEGATFYVVEVQAFDTDTTTQTYRLEAARYE